MQWWAWVAVGAILLGSELAFVDAQFYLVFLGLAALIVGLLDVAGLPLAVWAQWLVFTVLAVVSMFGFRQRIYEHMRRTLPIMRSGPAGEIVTLAAALGPGETCRVEYRGSSWSAINSGKSVIPAGAHARIERVDGLTLVVHLVANP
ncbi:MAG: NfeD family protein [Steroidobacteraceae bacterium]|jgi:membrane protein implicated in regulation of membrane protease activity